MNGRERNTAKTGPRPLIVFGAVLALLLGACAQLALAGAAPRVPGGGRTIVLRGTVVTPAVVIADGYVTVENGLITSVSSDPPSVERAVRVDTQGFIYPGLIDLHNHVSYNVLPRWTPPTLYSNHSQWQADPAYQQAIETPYQNVLMNRFCDMNAYGEMRALVGGATSTMVTAQVECIHGLVRNLDWNSGFYGNRQLDLEHVHAENDNLPPPTDPEARQIYAENLRTMYLNNPKYEAVVLHLAEGTDAASLEEFTFFQSQGLLTPKLAIVHGIPLGPSEFQAMASSGTSLVWSPRSNLTLYGQTADINAALDAEVRVALGPDWAITGSSNMLDELRFADEWNASALGGRLSDQQLVEMVTSIPARIAGIDDEVGTIQPGLRADLLVIPSSENDRQRPVTTAAPYRALIQARAADVRLVLIDGVPVYGDAHYMRLFWTEAHLEKIRVVGTWKELLIPTKVFARFWTVVARLKAALKAQGTSLAPLTEY